MVAQTLRYYRGARQVLTANFARLNKPLKLTLAVTYLCQYRCEMCSIWKKHPVGELSTDELLAFVQKNRGWSWADITGGEIFLRKDIGEVMEAIVRSWRDLLFLHFPTNGFQTDTIVDVARRMTAAGSTPIIITVSLDGDETLNDAIRGIKGGYRQQIATFNALRRMPGVRAVLGMTLSARNVGAFERTFRACQRACPGLEIEDFHLNVMQLSSHYYANTDQAGALPAASAALADVQAYRRLRRTALTPAGWVESSYLRKLEQFLGTGRTPMKCHSLNSSCFIDPWGQVFPCITYAKPVGSLREHAMDLAPIWQGLRARELQREIWDGSCPQCWTACEAYQSILGNALRPSHAQA